MEIVSTVSTILTMIRHDVAHVICNIKVAQVHAPNREWTLRPHHSRKCNFARFSRWLFSLDAQRQRLDEVHEAFTKCISAVDARGEIVSRDS